MSAATVTGNLTDISLAPLTTKLLFTPTTNVLLTASGLSAGPPKMVNTSSGAFSVDLEAGDYAVSLPLITYRTPFRISVFSTNGTVNITNLLSPPVTYTYTWQPLVPIHINTSPVTVWSTNSPQTLLDSACTLPAGALAAGKTITIDAFGLSTDPASNGPDLTFTLKLGSTTLRTQTKTTTGANWHLHALISSIHGGEGQGEEDFPLLRPSSFAKKRKHFANKWVDAPQFTAKYCVQSWSIEIRKRTTMKKLFTSSIHNLLCVGLLSCVSTASGQTWTQCMNAPGQLWYAVGCSSTGTKLIAAANPGGVYTSTNSGLTWISNSLPSKSWCAVTCSTDGRRLAAAASSPGAQIWASSDSGATWVLTGAPTGTYQNYTSMAASADGTKLAATGALSVPSTSYIYASADSGISWSPTSAPSYPWVSVASSSDGSRLVSAAYNWNAIATSIDQGANWTIHTPATKRWFAVASSADGAVLAATGLSLEAIFTSTNSGSTWISNSIPGLSGYCLAASGNGQTLFAGHAAGLYASTDAGQTWRSNNVPPYLWRSIACTPDGSRGVAAVASGPSTSMIWTLAAPQPSLKVADLGSTVAIMWPTSAASYQLQQSPSLPPSNWQDTTNPVALSNGQNVVTVLKTNGQGFFRLRGQ